MTRNAQVGGMTHWSICAAIEAGRNTMPEIVQALAGRAGAANTPLIVANLQRAGYLQLRDGIYRLTYKGREMLGPRAPTVEHSAYQPPARPPRRAGADDAARLPSMYAGKPDR